MKTHEELLAYTPEEYEFHHKCIDVLPSRAGLNGDFFDKYGVEIPFSCGAHVVKHFRETLKITGAKSVLEIGFNLGYSASMWLGLGVASLVSVEISDKDETLTAAKVLKEQYRGVFEFIRCDSAYAYPLLHNREFDLVFIDGGHEVDSAMVDIGLAGALNIPYLLFDDIYPQFGPGVQPAIAMFKNLELVKDMDNLALYTWE